MSEFTAPCETLKARHVALTSGGQKGSLGRGSHDLHEDSRPLTNAGLRVTARGGCVVSPRIQGCGPTESTPIVPVGLPEGGLADRSQFTTLPIGTPRAVAGDACEELTLAKRIVLFLNVSPPTQPSAALETAGVTAVYWRGFGTLQTPAAVLMSVKRAIREGRVLWIHGRVTPQHWSRPTWFTQCCRLAHRATAQWTLEFTRSPWHVKPFEALRRHKYVQNLGAAGTSAWYGSEHVRPHTTSVLQVLEQVAHGPVLKGDAARSLGDGTDAQGEATKKGIRHAEDAAAVGGLRNPHRSIAKIKKAEEFGRWLESLLASVIGEDDAEAIAASHTLGCEKIPQVLVDRARKIRAALSAVLKVQPGPEATLQGELIAGLATRLGDPDEPVRRWLRQGTVPLGISSPIEAGGVFPHAVSDYPDVDTDLGFWLDNYSSFAEHQGGAEEILRKERAKGWLEWSSSRKALEAKYGPITQNRIGVIAKSKKGKLKLRLIHDLRRSGVNSRVKFTERLILPRLADARDDILHAISQAGHDGWECAVLDHADAFKQLRVNDAERRYLGGSALNGWFVYCTVLFGIKSGPLVWGRTAALLMRLTSAATHGRARMQCFVDDPIITLWGTERRRSHTLVLIVVLWLAMGCKLAWPKGERGRRVEWIGAAIQPWKSVTGVSGVTLTITREKIEKLATLCDEVLGTTTPILMSRIRRLAGLATWMAGILPQITVYTARLWAATTTKQDYINHHQVITPVKWLRALCGQELRPILCHSRPPTGYFSLITFDASLSGGGATFQSGLRNLTEAASKPIVSYWQANWTDEDLATVQATKGAAADQAKLEAYALLVSVATWAKILNKAQGALHIRGDALGVLQGMLKFKARDPVLNAMAGELAYLIAPIGLDIRAAHIWSERNEVCDYLSRLPPGVPPEKTELAGAVRSKRLPVPKFLLNHVLDDTSVRGNTT